MAINETGKDVGKMTKKEFKKFMDYEGIHDVYHEFVKRFKNKDYTHKGKGYDLMQKVAKFAEKYPKDIEIVRCDDSYHAGSDLVMIHHFYKRGKNRGKNWGTSVIFIPQCSGEDPIEFFLYPNHQKNLLKVLTRAYKKAIKEY